MTNIDFCPLQCCPFHLNLRIQTIPCAAVVHLYAIVFEHSGSGAAAVTAPANGDNGHIFTLQEGDFRADLVEWNVDGAFDMALFELAGRAYVHDDGACFQQFFIVRCRTATKYVLKKI